MNKNDHELEHDVYGIWLRGARPETAAKLFGISVEQASEIIRRAVARQPSPENQSPVDIIREHLARVDSAIEELGLIASKEKDLVHIRAIEGRYNALKHKFEVYQAMGVLPADLGQMGIVYNGVKTANRLIDVLEEHDVLTEEILEAMEQALSVGRGIIGSQDEDPQAGPRALVRE